MREIAGANANTEIQNSARLIAEAQIDVRRVRQARHQLLTDALRDPDYDYRTKVGSKVKLLGSFLRPKAADTPTAALTNILNSSVALILLQRLEALERYERRAVSRRSVAVQLFDRAAGSK